MSSNRNTVKILPISGISSVQRLRDIPGEFRSDKAMPSRFSKSTSQKSRHEAADSNTSSENPFSQEVSHPQPVINNGAPSVPLVLIHDDANENLGTRHQGHGSESTTAQAENNSVTSKAGVGITNARGKSLVSSMVQQFNAQSTRTPSERLTWQEQNQRGRADKDAYALTPAQKPNQQPKPNLKPKTNLEPKLRQAEASCSTDGQVSQHAPGATVPTQEIVTSMDSPKRSFKAEQLGVKRSLFDQGAGPNINTASGVASSTAPPASKSITSPLLLPPPSNGNQQQQHQQPNDRIGMAESFKFPNRAAPSEQSTASDLPPFKFKNMTSQKSEYMTPPKAQAYKLNLEVLPSERAASPEDFSHLVTSEGK